MNAPKRPPPRETLGGLLGELHELPPPPEAARLVEPSDLLEQDDDDHDVAAELEKEAQPKQRRPRHRSGSLKHPYKRARGDQQEIVKTALNFSVGFAEEFHLFAAEFLRLSSKSAWAERVLSREIARTRKRARKPAG